MASDVLVVGSGPGGGIIAYVLATLGVKVTLMEAGRRLRPGVDYNAHWPVYEKLDERLAQGYGPVSSVFRDFAERNHFTGVGDRPAHGYVRALGGRSLCWAGHSLRFGPLDFRAWPISYEQLAPYYDRAELLMGVHGQRDGLSNLPDGQFQKPVPMRCMERQMGVGVAALRAKGKQMAFIPMRKAMPTERKPGGRAVCHYCGHCMNGCEVDSKYTSANTPIPKALATGNLTLLTESMMTRLLLRDGLVQGVEYQDRTGERRQLQARAVVLACSTIETARHLLFNQIANESGQVGKNLCSHFGITLFADFPMLRGRDASNDDGTDYYHSLLTGLYWDQPAKNFAGTYQVQCGGGLHPLRLPVRDIPGFGKNLKRALRQVNSTHGSMNMQGTTLVSPRKFVELDRSRPDAYGIPLPKIHLHFEDNDLAMAKDCQQTCEEILSAAGAKLLSKPGDITPEKLVIDSNHWVGTARMGTDRRTSVVNPFGQSHDVKNLFVGDPSVFPAYPEKNPTLTNIALGWRMAENLAELLRKGDL